VIQWEPDRPKWEQIADQIQQGIKDGTYPPGGRVPSVHQLVQEYGVARATAEKALTRLRERGLIYTVQGLGSFVAKDQQRGREG